MPTARPLSYRCGVLLDMVGDADLQLFEEPNSLWRDDIRPLVDAIWATAARLGVKEFIARRNMTFATITCRCTTSAAFRLRRDRFRLSPMAHAGRHARTNARPLSLAKVGWVIGEWLEGLEQGQGMKDKG